MQPKQANNYAPSVVPSTIWVCSRVLLAVTIIFVYVPFRPVMPDVGGDYSWWFGMNQATAQGLVINKDVVFTYGPYASVFTKAYHPGTDFIMLLGGFTMAAFASWLLLRMGRDRSVFWHVAFSLFFAAGTYARDAVLLFYPLLVTAAVYKTVSAGFFEKKLSLQETGLIACWFVPFGLLINIKGSYLIPVLGIALFTMFLCWKKRQDKLMTGIFISIAISAVAFTLVAHQPVSSLGHFFAHISAHVSGYSYAMSGLGPKKEILLYLMSAALILYICLHSNNGSYGLRLYLFCTIGLILFMFYKSGFTRHFSHGLIAAVGLFLTSFTVYSIVVHRLRYHQLVMATVVWAFISYRYVGNMIFDVFKPVPVAYTEGVEGLYNRLANDSFYLQKFNAKLAEIRNLQPRIPTMQGTTDLYSYEQTYLLASKNKWAPRPVFQSYAAYTHHLAELNANFLLSKMAPDNIIFRLQSIDNRLPSLDDGLSWPLIINNYRPDSIDVGFLYLKKRGGANKPAHNIDLFSKKVNFGEEVLLPQDSTAIYFVEMNIKETPVGKLVSVIHQPEPVEIAVILNDGVERKYKLIPLMCKAGFVLSPMVETVEEFKGLFGNNSLPKNKQVKSFRIAHDGLGIRKFITSWQPSYQVNVKKLVFDRQ